MGCNCSKEDIETLRDKEDIGIEYKHGQKYSINNNQDSITDSEILTLTKDLNQQLI